MSPSQVTAAQSRQQLSNCALLLAYALGSPGGWYGISKGSIEGFTSDYAILHDNPANLAAHPIRAFYLLGDESELQELEEARQAVADEHDGELPLVTTLTLEEIHAAIEAVREAIEEESPEDLEQWLIDLCGTGSQIDYCQWDEVIDRLAIKRITTTIQGRELTLKTIHNTAILTSGNDWCHYHKTAGDFEPTAMTTFFTRDWTEESEAKLWEEFTNQHGYTDPA